MIFDITLKGQSLSVPSDLVLAAGARETVSIRIIADEAWDGLTLTLTCRTVYFVGVETRTVSALNPSNVTIPHENLIPGALYLGVTGYGADGSKKLTTAKMVTPIDVHESESDTADGSTAITPELGAQILAQIGNLANLKTSDRETIVAAINSIYTYVYQGLLGAYEKALSDFADCDLLGLPIVDGNSETGFTPMEVQSQENEKDILPVPTVGTVKLLLKNALDVLAGEDIGAAPAYIPNFSGTVDDALDALAYAIFHGKLGAFRSALTSFGDSDAVGLPVMDPDSETGFSPMLLDRGKDEEGPFSVPTTARLAELLEGFKSGGLDF
ncbi:MAG: hypothetical protein J6K89_07905, partial [Oscillospiraceae bacterium]|nr:hypothetical protein [Oscillospiraceae bacterium]